VAHFLFIGFRKSMYSARYCLAGSYNLSILGPVSFRTQ